MIHNDFLNQVIDDGIEAARMDYINPRSHLKLQGSIKGFEECRGLDVIGLSALLNRAHVDTNQKRMEQASDYWYWRCREIEIEWVCNVVSALGTTDGSPTIIQPTARGVLKAAEILGVRQPNAEIANKS